MYKVWKTLIILRNNLMIVLRTFGLHFPTRAKTVAKHYSIETRQFSDGKAVKKFSHYLHLIQKSKIHIDSRHHNSKGTGYQSSLATALWMTFLRKDHHLFNSCDVGVCFILRFRERLHAALYQK